VPHIQKIGKNMTVGICFPNMRGERGEREHTGANVEASPPLSPWALFIGEVEITVYILFHWWSEILQVCPQIFTTRSLEVVIKCLYL
jgi:hypothetical protein